MWIHHLPCTALPARSSRTLRRRARAWGSCGGGPSRCPRCSARRRVLVWACARCRGPRRSPSWTWRRRGGARRARGSWAGSPCGTAPAPSCSSCTTPTDESPSEASKLMQCMSTACNWITIEWLCGDIDNIESLALYYWHPRSLDGLTVAVYHQVYSIWSILTSSCRCPRSPSSPPTWTPSSWWSPGRPVDIISSF